MDIKQLDKEYIASTYSRADVLFVRGEGGRLYDDKGGEYIDFGSGIGVNILGHNYAPWKAAVTAQLGKIAHTSNLYYSEPDALLARRLHELTGMKRAFFSNSGAEANECAIKCARKYSSDKYGENRYKIVTLKDSFHGRTITTLAATGQDVFHKHFGPFPEGFEYADPGDIADLDRKLDGGTCALMIEVVQGESGVNVLDREYVLAAAEMCRTRDIVLIVDEVQSGNGRTGSLYAYMQYGIEPDIVTTAKGLGGGLPLGATMMFDRCADVFTYGTHGSTFGGNPVSCAGALAVLDALDDRLLARVTAAGEKIRSALKNAGKVRSVSGLGLMIGIEPVGGLTAAGAASMLRDKGLVVLTAKNKIRLLPPLNLTDEELDKGISILTEVLK